MENGAYLASIQANHTVIHISKIQSTMTPIKESYFATVAVFDEVW